MRQNYRRTANQHETDCGIMTRDAAEEIMRKEPRVHYETRRTAMSDRVRLIRLEK